jgi:hypothetical protein
MRYLTHRLSRKIRWAGDVARTKLELPAKFYSEKRIERSHVRDRDIDGSIALKLSFKFTTCQDVGWIHLAQVMVQRYALENMVINLWIP